MQGQIGRVSGGEIEQKDGHVPGHAGYEGCRVTAANKNQKLDSQLDSRMGGKGPSEKKKLLASQRREGLGWPDWLGVTAGKGGGEFRKRIPSAYSGKIGKGVRAWKKG